jgi:hypothetical protein
MQTFIYFFVPFQVPDFAGVGSELDHVPFPFYRCSVFLKSPPEEGKPTLH